MTVRECLVSGLSVEGKAALARELAERVRVAEAALALLGEGVADGEVFVCPPGKVVPVALVRAEVREAVLQASLSGYAFALERVAHDEWVRRPARIEAVSGVEAVLVPAREDSPAGQRGGSLEPPAQETDKPAGPIQEAPAASSRVDPPRAADAPPRGGGRVVRVARPVPALQPKLEGLGLRPEPGGDYVAALGPAGDAEADLLLVRLRERRVFFTVEGAA